MPTIRLRAVSSIKTLPGTSEAPAISHQESNYRHLPAGRFVGRWELFDRLRELTTSLKPQDPRIIVLEGDAGSGRTRMLREVAINYQLQGQPPVQIRRGDPRPAPFGWLHDLVSAVRRATTKMQT